MWRGKAWGGKKWWEVSRTHHCAVSGRERSAHQAGPACRTEWTVSFQVPVTLEDMAVYLSQEEWGCLDPAQQDRSWDMLPESEGNMWGDPGCYPLETMMSGVGQS